MIRLNKSNQYFSEALNKLRYSCDVTECNRLFRNKLKVNYKTLVKIEQSFNYVNSINPYKVTQSKKATKFILGGFKFLRSFPK